MSSSTTSGLKPVLIILHQPTSTPGRIGRLLRGLGYRLDIRRPVLGDPLPDTMKHHAGAIIFGGPMSANDPDPFIRTEIDWIKVPLRENAPFLGVCLGAQMLASHFGQRIYPHPEGRVEIGYYPITPTPAAEAMFGGAFPRRVYQWHNEGFDKPAGATLLATGLDFECQAFCHGPAFAVQFHPEVTYAMMCKWTVMAAHRLTDLGARPARVHLEGWFQYDAAVARWSEAFLRSWVSGGRVPALPDQAMHAEHAFAADPSDGSVLIP
ncbi:glutamine amidotransferase [Lichenihabitans sp. PAMC28606]|uniref:glutamine amidotransferase n=1 Tax=Lichenihabitans sp. PAMC28606 TaxID=2880932 RepID=UPI001D0BBF82|nr:glutamine amidotransferase [Lichenihabitans sp. PAMC28606]UDL96449.1 glutamine amidotransferase [Lichenihabitans sp. PAMC28606]